MSIDNFLRLWIFCCCCGSEIFSTIMLKYFFWFLNPNSVNLVFWQHSLPKFSNNHFKRWKKKSGKICNLFFHLLEASDASKQDFSIICFFTIKFFCFVAYKYPFTTQKKDANCQLCILSATGCSLAQRDCSECESVWDLKRMMLS